MIKHVMQIQTDLKNAGLYNGKIDGIVGNRTVEAVREALGIEPTTGQELKDMQLSDKGLKLIEEFEGFRSHPYKDLAGVVTIGYGTTYYPNGKKVSLSDKPLTEQEAHKIKQTVIDRDFVPEVRGLLSDSKVPITQDMFDALVSLVYNIGVDAFKHSSVLRYLKNGDKQSAANAMLMWNKANGRVIGGLAKRREAERELFLA